MYNLAEMVEVLVLDPRSELRAPVFVSFAREIEKIATKGKPIDMVFP